MALAIAASLPIGLSHKMYRFYFMPAMSFYALAFGHLAYGLIPNRLGLILQQPKVLKGIATGFAALAISISCFTLLKTNTPHRDPETMAIAKELKARFQDQTLNYCGHISSFALYSYAYRYGKISLEFQEEKWSPTQPTLIAPTCKNKDLLATTINNDIFTKHEHRLVPARLHTPGK